MRHASMPLFALVLVVACDGEVGPRVVSSPGRSVQRVDAHSVPIDVAPHLFTYVDWLDANTLAVGYDPRPDEPVIQGQIATIDLETGSFVAVQVEVIGPCSAAESFSNVDALPDGRIAFNRECGSRAAIDHVAVDPSSGHVERLMSEPIGRLGTPTAGVIWSGGFSWNPKLTKGIADVGNRLCGSLIWLEREGPQFGDFTLVDGDSTWNAREFFDTYGSGQDCLASGYAATPAWSPTGDVVAFVGTTNGCAGTWCRLDQPLDVYLLDVASNEARPIFRGVIDPTSVRWSPDGAWLAIVAGSEGDRGIFILRSDGSDAMFLPAEGVGHIAWSPDGTELAAVIWPAESIDVEPTETTLLRFQVASLLGV